MPAVLPGASGSAGLCWLAASRTPWGGFRATAASAFSLVELEGGCHLVVGAGHRVCSFLCGPTLTSVHYYWKNHSFHYTDLYW